MYNYSKVEVAKKVILPFCDRSNPNIHIQISFFTSIPIKILLLLFIFKMLFLILLLFQINWAQVIVNESGCYINDPKWPTDHLLPDNRWYISSPKVCWFDIFRNCHKANFFGLRHPAELIKDGTLYSRERYGNYTIL